MSAGLTFGAFFWGIAVDLVGRRIAYNSTVLITCVFVSFANRRNTWGKNSGTDIRDQLRSIRDPWSLLLKTTRLLVPCSLSVDSV
jgi:hypothetical protein